MAGALLRQCVMENNNPRTKNILVTLPADASIEVMLERMSRVPIGTQAFITELATAMGKKLGEKLAESQVQAFAALGPLRPLSTGQTGKKSGKGLRCYRCGNEGHVRRQCSGPVWCNCCKRDSHATAACQYSGNGKKSMPSRHALTTIAAPALPTSTPVTPLVPLLTQSSNNPFTQHKFFNQPADYDPPQKGALDWTWQPQ